MLIYKDEEIVLNFVLRVNGTMKKKNKKEKVSRCWLKWIKKTHTLTTIKNSSTGWGIFSSGWENSSTSFLHSLTGCNWLKNSWTDWQTSSTLPILHFFGLFKTCWHFIWVGWCLNRFITLRRWSNDIRKYPNPKILKN